MNIWSNIPQLMPVITTPSGTNKYGNTFKEYLDYECILGMRIYRTLGQIIMIYY